MAITSIAMYHKETQQIDLLYTELAEQDRTDYEMVISYIDTRNTDGIFSFAPHLDNQCIVFLQHTPFRIVMFMATEVLTQEAALKVMHEIKDYHDNHLSMNPLIHHVNNHVLEKYQPAPLLKIHILQQLLDETKLLILKQISKMLDRQEKIEHLQQKLNTMALERPDFKTRAFQPKKRDSFFSFFHLTNTNNKSKNLNTKIIYNRSFNKSY